MHTDGVYSTGCFSGRLDSQKAPNLPILNDITLGRYIPGDSALHRLDPRVKIGCSVAFMGAVLGTGSGVVLLGCLILLSLLGRRSGLPLRLLLGNLKPLIPILLLTLGLNAVLTPGKTAYTLPNGLGDLTWEGIARGLFLTVRLSTLVVGTSLLTLTTSPLALADGLESLLSPFRRLGLPAHELAMTTTIALRFVPILVDEADRLRRAQLARGADFGGGPVRRVRSLLPLLLPLFISAFGRADRLAVAMEARCYRGNEGRTRFGVLCITGTDCAVLAATLLASGVILSAGYF